MEFLDFLSQSPQHSMFSLNMPSYGNKRLQNTNHHRLNILHLDPEKAWGGGEVQVSGLTTYLHNSGHHSVVAADQQGVLYTQLRQAALPVIPFRIRNHLDILAGFQLRRLVSTQKFDIVHFHTARAHALSLWLCGLPSKRIVTRRMDYALRPGLGTRLLYIYSVDMIIAISRGVQTALAAGEIPTNSIRLIPSGVDMKRFAPDLPTRHRIRVQYGLDPYTPLVVSIGSLVERKNHSTLLKSARSLKTQGQNIRYLISGDGPLRSALQEQSQALGLTQEVQFIGFCSEVPGLLSAADIFVHIPLHEGLGVAVIEALAAGLPTIASRTGGIPEIIENGETGILIAPHDSEALSAALITYITNQKFAHQLGTAGQTFVRSRFDMKTMAQTNEALYLELLADTP
jgi:glycosyltransferase involved in cell wall biosynthesis